MKTKICDTCKLEKALKDFYGFGNTPRGRSLNCKECVRIYTRERYKRLRQDPGWMERERVRCRERNLRLGYSEKYKPKTKKQKLARRLAASKWIAKNRDKRAAQILVGSALRSGRLTKAACEVCGELKVDAHHDDYTKPLEVRWLCEKHHMQLHRKDLDED
jgi:hypothetical protein